jgi:hypothetical protein
VGSEVRSGVGRGGRRNRESEYQRVLSVSVNADNDNAIERCDESV